MRKAQRKLALTIAVMTPGADRLEKLILAVHHDLSKKVGTLMSKLDELKAENSAMNTAIQSLIEQDDANTQALRDLQKTIADGGAITSQDIDSIIATSQASRQAIADTLKRDSPVASETVAPSGDAGETVVDTATGGTQEP